ncbi:hypothetical protein C0993_008437, partial [Termitomyces sp. T159_Od127]
VGRVPKVLESNKTFFDTPRTDEAIENGNAAGLVIRAACTSTTKGLLTNDGSSAFLIIVDIAGRIAKAVSGG